MSPHALGLLLLLLVTVVWGSTFPIIKDATRDTTPATLIAWRFTLALLPLLWFLRGTSRALWRDGAVLGLWLIGGYATQTIGLTTTSANRAAFITGLSVVLVPLWLALTGSVRPGVRVWGAALLAVVGLAVLTGGGGPLVIGDLWVLGCAVTYAGYILALERVSGRHRSLPLTAVQIAVVAALGWLWALGAGGGPGGLVLPHPEAWGALVYLGIIATAITTFLQTFGQQRVAATEAAIIYAMEPVTASLFSWWLLSERIGLAGLLGGALVVAAMIWSQWPSRAARHAVG